MRLLNRLLSYFPTRLPVGLTEFNAWSSSIIDLAGNFADEDSMRWAIANMVMHLPSTKSRVSKNYFVQCLTKTAANQVAGQVFINIKEKQEALRKAAEEAAKAAAPTTPAEATATPQAASNGVTQG